MDITYFNFRLGGQAVIASIQSKIRDSNAVDDILRKSIALIDRGTIPLRQLLDIFEEHEVYLDSKECDLIDRRFSSPNGAIEYHRLMKTLDFGIPSDHIDPDHFADPLPQPYRMICKLLELEIIDNAWNEILRRYPEVHEEIPGKNTIVRRNRNLDIECFASSQSDRSKPIPCMVSGGGFVYTVNAAGAFIVVDNTTAKAVQTLQVFPEEQEPSFLRIHLTNASSMSASSGWCRVAVLKIGLAEKVVEPEPDKNTKAVKTKPKGKTVAPTPEVEPVARASPGFKCGVSLVEVSTDGRSVECKFVHSFDCLLYDSDVYTDMSEDGRALLICHGTDISLFKFPVMGGLANPFAKKMDDINEDEAADTAEDTLTPPSNTARLCQWNMREEILKQLGSGKAQEKMSQLIPEGTKVLSCHLFPFDRQLCWDDGAPQDPTDISTSAAAGVAGNGVVSSSVINHKDEHEKQFHNGLAVFLQETKAWFVFGMRSGLQQEPSLDLPPALNITGPQVALELIGHWVLSGPVSALDMDDKKAVLAIGQDDGVVSLWDLRSMQFLSAPSRHSSAVTAITLTTGVDSHLMVSGDKEGVMCFYQLHAAAGAQSVAGGRSSSQTPSPSTRPCLKAHLVDFRMDFRDEVLNMWRIDGVSIVVVQIASGKLVVYDAEGSDLLGRLCLTSGIPGQKLEYALVTVGDCIIDTSSDMGQTHDGAPSRAESMDEGARPKRKSAVQIHRERVGIGASCSNGFCAFFSRVGMKSVMSCFNLEKMLSFLYPGIAVLTEKKRTRDIDILVLYGLLTPSERMNDKIRVSDVSVFGEGGIDKLSSCESSKSLLRSGSKSPLSRKGSRLNLTRSMKSSHGGTSSGGITLTAEHLMELEKKYMPLSAPVPPLPLALSSYERIALPRMQFEKSVKSSQIERAKRKAGILNSMQQMAELF